MSFFKSKLSVLCLFYLSVCFLLSLFSKYWLYFVSLLLFQTLVSSSHVNFVRLFLPSFSMFRLLLLFPLVFTFLLFSVASCLTIFQGFKTNLFVLLNTKTESKLVAEKSLISYFNFNLKRKFLRFSTHSIFM